jgi:glucokinase
VVRGEDKHVRVDGAREPQSTHGEPCFVGVDLGGTQLRVAAVNPDGGLATELFSVATGRDFGPDDLVRELSGLVERLRPILCERPIDALGFGTAGVVCTGPLTQSENLPRLNGVDIAELVGSALSRRVTIENDARCFVLAETRFGAAKGFTDVAGITLGTGVGCGLMLGGRLHRGVAGEAGEVWRVPLRGEPLERSVSGAGVVRSYRAAGGNGGAAVGAAEVAEAARRGDEPARSAWRTFGEDLAFLCQCVLSLVDPQRIVLGGSLTSSRDLFEATLRRHLARRSVRLAYGELGAAAGVIGAAALNIA